MPKSLTNREWWLAQEVFKTTLISAITAARITGTPLHDVTQKLLADPEWRGRLRVAVERQVQDYADPN